MDIGAMLQQAQQARDQNAPTGGDHQIPDK